MKTILAALLVISAINLAYSQTTCKKPFQIYKRCGPSCPPKCDESIKQVCTAKCVPGCFCKDGYALDNNNTCIPQSKCPQITCPANKEYNECGSACPPTCDVPNPACIKKCVPGCFCKAGYVLNKTGNCVLKDKCPPSCPANMEYTDCGTACPPTCGEPKAKFCTLQCIIGCVCKKGYSIHKNGTCVLPSQC